MEKLLPLRTYIRLQLGEALRLQGVLRNSQLKAILVRQKHDSSLYFGQAAISACFSPADAVYSCLYNRLRATYLPLFVELPSQLRQKVIDYIQIANDY